MIKKQAMIEKNIELSAEFSRYLFDHPEFEKQIPEDAEMILLPEFDEQLKKFNVEMGKEMESEGTKVIYISIKQMRPKTYSRIEKVKFASVA